MTCWTRRQFACLAATACLSAFDRATAWGQARGRVVVVGGGVAGATVAKYLAVAAPGLDIVLVEPKSRYTTCFFSNLYLAGLRSLDSLTHGYEALSRRYGISVVHDRASMIDPTARKVALAGGVSFSYDRLVLAPGIDFRSGAIDGYDEGAMQAMPHAWTAGPQTVLLRRQLESMEDGGVFAIVAPPNPFRCPPGPYERASLVAYYFKQYKRRAKILILDAKNTFFEQELFEDAWDRHCPGMIEWLPSQFTGGVRAVDSKSVSIITAGDTFKAAVANVIPAQMAGRLAQDAGLADASGWCPVDPATFGSKLQPDVHLIGDAISAGEMPKSAFAANSQAKVCAFAIAAALAGSEPPAAHLFNTCYTLLAADDAVSDAIVFKAAAGTIRISDIFVSRVGEDAAVRREAVRQANGWYHAFTHDVFG